MVAAIGIAAGMGLYVEAIMTTIVSYIILAGLWMVEKYLTREIRYKGEGIFGELKEGVHHVDINSEK